VRTTTGHSDNVRSVAFSWHGTRIVSGSDDGLVKIWDVATGVEVRCCVVLHRSKSRLLFREEGLIIGG
jgi:WD40 repeat protein